MESPAAEGGGSFSESLGSLLFPTFPGQGLSQPDLEPQILGIHVGHKLEDIYLLVFVVLPFVNFEKVFENGQGLSLKPLAFIEFRQLFVGGKELRIQTKNGPVYSYCLGREILSDVAGGNLFIVLNGFLFPPGSGQNFSKTQNKPLIVGINLCQLLEGFDSLVQVPLGQVFLRYLK